MAAASDLFSKLPDELLCFIISYLPIKEAVRSSVLAKRWRYLYHQLPELQLSPDLLLDPAVIPNPLTIAHVESIISNILLLHSSDLETFDVYTSDDWHFSYENICKWVQCVASKNVEYLSLRHFQTPFGPLHPREILPPSLFLCNKLSTLALSHYIVSKIPTGFGGFNHLTDCYFNQVEFRDDSLALFLSHCPLLETLELYGCVVPQNIRISAPRIGHLKIEDSNPVEILTVNCPKLTYFSLGHVKDLRVNGLSFQGLSSVVRFLYLQCGSTVIHRLSLDLGRDGTNSLSAERWVEIIRRFKFLKVLSIGNLRGEKMHIPITNLLQGLPHLERLNIYRTLCLRLSKDPNPTSLESPLLNLRKVSAECRPNYDEKEIDVLVWLLGNAPAIDTMDVAVPPPSPGQAGEEEKYIQLLQRILDSNFRRPSAPARVRVTEDPALLKPKILLY